MKYTIDRERLASTFATLCEISSPSKQEGKIAEHLKECFAQLRADSIVEDDSASQTGSECGNLIIRFNGSHEGEGLFFSCHMDTVEPGTGVKVKRDGDIFTSVGDTILGSDDKSGIAALIEMLTIIRENKIPHPPIEIIITTCEEIGLLGAKSLDYSKITTPFGYALDSSGINAVVIGAPAANKFTIEITGEAAHAGLHPEDGISAIQVAAKAIDKIKLGRIDDETTANFGLIEGGTATNIIPERVVIQGEVRSHSAEKLASYTEQIERIFKEVVDTWQNSSPANNNKPTLKMDTMSEYPAFNLAMDSSVAQKVKKAGDATGKALDFKVAGGGSDANIFCAHGKPTAIVATGMNKVHTTDEQLDLNDLTELTELVLALALDAE